MGSLPQQILMSGRLSLRQYVFRTRNADGDTRQLLWANAFTIATVLPSAVADGLAELQRLWTTAAANGDIGNFKFRKDAAFTTQALQPSVVTRCAQTLFVPNKAVSLEFPSLRNISLVELTRVCGSVRQ
ncbi:hypothetical protein K469DRAFT_339973 [Zopfia rhizophila CBS 207.26]|uniref:Uncharacterized protein n=1 Tax=Zopfia rhizophila CBS 207.26 TaxID=1314779 RepID=A0A6A6DIT2_9PEZI|nr:hypothetical protein K469DRAFT_339973 [Zopfia rhizophila CBS 207.26]